MTLTPRTILVGVLAAATVQFGLMALRYRRDAVRSLAAMFAYHACVVVGARVVLANGPSAMEAAIATRVLYSALVCGAVVLPVSLQVANRRQIGSLVAVGVLLAIGIWWDGVMFDPRVVHRAPLPTESFDVLAPGPYWWPTAAAIMVMMVASARLAASTTDPMLQRVVRALALVVTGAMIWDVLVDAGMLRGPILAGWASGISIAALAVVAFRRSRIAHGDLVTQLDEQRLALEREQEILAVQEQMGALGSLAEGLGHELNNPLAAVSLNVAWLEDALSDSLGRVPSSLSNARRLTRELEEAMQAFTSQFRPAGQVATSVPPTSAARRAKPRVLVVDDDPLITKALRRSLTGFEVNTANSADEALGAIGSVAFDAVLCDVMMPEVTGVELYHQVAELHPELAKRFVLLTGGTFGEGVDESMVGIPCPVLKKPIDVPEIKKALRRRIAAAKANIERDEPDPEEAPPSLGSSRRR